MEGEGNIKGVVIIRLPSPDNPSEGKTIAGALAFTENPYFNPSPNLNASPSPSPNPSGEGNVEDDHMLPLRSNPESRISNRLKRRRFRPLRSKRLASVLFAAMVVYFFWQYGPSTLKLEEGSQDSDNTEKSEQAMVYSIYSKVRVYPSLNSSSLPSVPAYPSNSVPISPSAISKLVERDVVRNSRVGSEAEAAPSADSKETTTTIFPLRGNVYPDGLYYVSARVGNPSQEYFLDMDTGSDLTWLQCDAPCTSCAKGPHPLYKPRKANLVDCSEASCSAAQVGSKFGCDQGSGQCDYEIMYADGGYSLGVLVHDRLAMILTNRSWGYTKAVFGCAYDQQGSLAKSPTPTDGVLGLSSSAVSLPSQLAEQGLIKNIIAHCIPADGSGAGYLFFGDKLLPSRGMTWAPLLGKPVMKNYALAMENFYYGDIPIDKGSNVFGTAIFDSGTSYTYLVSSLYAAVVSTIRNSLIGSGLQHDVSDNTLPLCWRRDTPFSSLEDVQHIFKPIILEFKSSSWLIKTSKMQLAPEGYLIINSKGNVCLGLLDAHVMEKDGLSILGDISMRGSLVVYDNENNRLGWMKMDCRRIPNAAVLSPSI